jgi:hypothetical protein
MPRELPRGLPEVIDVQSGVVGRSQALRLGLDRDAIWNQLRSRRWQQLHRSVYATFSGEPPRLAQLWAVVLCAGPGATLSHYTAAEVLGLANKPSRLVHVAVSAARHPSSSTAPWCTGRGASMLPGIPLSCRHAPGSRTQCST